MPLNIQQIRSQLPTRQLHHFDTIDTTMREAAALAAAGAAPGTTVIAEEQTAGQGRHGHTWHSEKGRGLYLSILLHPKQAAAPTLTMALGLATADAISASTALPCDLRWPNDVMVNGKKVAGILTQLTESSAIAGIGINVNHDHFPASLSQEATSLLLESGGRPQSRERILLDLLPAVDRYAALLASRGPDPIVELFSRRSSYATGKRVVVHQGDTLVSGTTAGLNAAGFLVVRKDDGSDEIILAGGVRATGAGRG
jgi:BirA family transcriptional regulator, biotin operon repressor / biotin---[acetyl-CoA-carboxylase] ligase